MAKTIYAVNTDAGIVTRASETMTYNYAAVSGHYVVAWSATRDGAEKNARRELRYARDRGFKVVPCYTLDKQPKDPNPGIKTYNSSRQTDQGGTRYSQMVIDEDGKKYVKVSYGVYREADDQDIQGDTITGYIDRLYIAYLFKTWKAVQALQPVTVTILLAEGTELVEGKIVEVVEKYRPDDGSQGYDAVKIQAVSLGAIVIRTPEDPTFMVDGEPLPTLWTPDEVGNDGFVESWKAVEGGR